MQLRVDTRHGLLEAALDLPATGLTLAGLAGAVLPLAGQVEALAARHAAGRMHPPACAKGCGACCRQLVTVSPAEAWMIADLIGALPPPARAATRRRFEQAVAALAQAALRDRLERLDDPALDEAAHYALARDYFTLALPCPFLDDGGACAIHPRRPALCREYLVSSPPARCAEPFARPPARVPLAAEVSQALLGLCAQVLRRPLEPVPLVLAPQWAADHAADALRSWDSRRLMDRFLLHLEVHLNFES